MSRSERLKPEDCRGEHSEFHKSVVTAFEDALKRLVSRDDKHLKNPGSDEINITYGILTRVLEEQGFSFKEETLGNLRAFLLSNHNTYRFVFHPTVSQQDRMVIALRGIAGLAMDETYGLEASVICDLKDNQNASPRVRYMFYTRDRWIRGLVSELRGVAAEGNVVMAALEATEKLLPKPSFQYHMVSALGGFQDEEWTTIGDKDDWALSRV